MILNKIKLKNYRNYDNLELELDKRLNIFIGENAQGKTNILESIYVLGITKSHLAVNDKSLMKFDKEFTSIIGEINIEGFDKKLEININKLKKTVKINDKEVSKFADYISKFNIIIFSPNDVRLIKNNPMTRRRYLNIEISQLDNKYVYFMNNYNHILKIRNDILKENKSNKQYDNSYIDIINGKFVELSADIYLSRKKFIDDINMKISNIYEQLTGDKGLNIKYVTSVSISDDKEYIKDQLFKKIKENNDKEKNYGTSLYGPHRDDFLFYLDNIDLSLYGSQGQQRMAIIALKLSEMEIFNELKKENPILLLDDLFSELDNDKQNKLIKFINNGYQTIITTTDIDKINNELVKNAQIYVVKNGKVEVITNE